jgi:glycosyltransferase involved in cell wall biosynthesis
MRIALVSAFLHDDSIGGAENHIRFLCHEFQDRGYRIRVFKPVVGPVALNRIEIIDGVEIEYVCSGSNSFDARRFAGMGLLGRAAGLARKLSFCQVTKSLCDSIEAFRPDVIWQHDFLSSWAACRKLAAHYPVVLTNHQGQFIILNATVVGNRLLRWMMSHYEAVIGPSRELTPGWHAGSRTIYNGVDCNRFSMLDDAERTRLREALYGPDAHDRLVIFCPRRWAPTKGVLIFAQALEKLENRRPDLCKRIIATFAGDSYPEYPRYARSVQNVVERLNIPCKLMGALEVYEMVRHYQCADLIVIPSLMEAVSLSALEAMACGTPVLATTVGGMPELINHNVTGFLTKPGDSDAFSREIERVLIDSQLRRFVSIMGRRLVSAKFTWRIIADQTSRVLEDVVFDRQGLQRAGDISLASANRR